MANPVSDFFKNMFGFQLDAKQDEKEGKEKENQTFALPSNDDGAFTIQSGAYYGTYVDLDGAVRNEVELITKYREMALLPEVEAAIDDIVNEAIVQEESGECVKMNLDDLDMPDSKSRRKFVTSLTKCCVC
jgi:hypothetical protein